MPFLPIVLPIFPELVDKLLWDLEWRSCLDWEFRALLLALLIRSYRLSGLSEIILRAYLLRRTGVR